MANIQYSQYVNILGVRFQNLTHTETVEFMEGMISIGKPHMICTPNADHVVCIQRDREFKDIIANADLVVADGMAVVYASYLLGKPLKQNVGGRLLLPSMAKLSASKGYRIFLLGGSSPLINQKATDQLRRDYPGIRIVGHYSPPLMSEFDETETARMISLINASKPDVLFVCLGTPKQEKWIAHNLDRLSPPVCLGIGVALDMIAGKVRQPPRWISEIGFEWLFRMLQEPKRLYKRYLINDLVFFYWVLQQRLGIRNGRSH